MGIEQAPQRVAPRFRKPEEFFVGATVCTAIEEMRAAMEADMSPIVQTDVIYPSFPNQEVATEEGTYE